MKTLNGLPIFHSMDLFQKEDHLWEECTQEEDRLIEKEEQIDEDENQSLTTHTKKRKNKKEEHSLKNKNISEEEPLIAQIFHL